MFVEQYDWLLNLGISEWTIHLRAKQDGVRFVEVTEEERFLKNEVAVLDNTKEATKCGQKIFKDLYTFYFSVVNALRMCSKYFVYK